MKAELPFIHHSSFRIPHSQYALPDGRASASPGAIIHAQKIRRIPRKGQGFRRPEMSFSQQPPQLGNQYADDRALRSYLRRALPPEVLREVEPSLLDLGELAGG